MLIIEILSISNIQKSIIAVKPDRPNIFFFFFFKSYNPACGLVPWQGEAELMSEFNFVITYCLGEKNSKTDALSCQTDPTLEGGDMPQISMFKPGQLAPLESTNLRVMRITALKDGDELLFRYVMSVCAKKSEPIKLDKQIPKAGLTDNQ